MRLIIGQTTAYQWYAAGCASGGGCQSRRRGSGGRDIRGATQAHAEPEPTDGPTTVRAALELLANPSVATAVLAETDFDVEHSAFTEEVDHLAVRAMEHHLERRLRSVGLLDRG